MRSMLLGINLIVALPVHAQAQQPAKPTAPDALLPAKSLAFFRYDGYEPHRAAYDKTALAKAMKDDLGDFIDHVLELATDAFIKSTFPQDAEEKKEDEPKKEEKKAAKDDLAKKAAEQFAGALKYFWKHGMVVSLEVPDVNRWQLHVVFPDGGTPQNRAALLPILQMLGEMGGQKLQTTQRQGRTIAWQTWRTRQPANPPVLPKIELLPPPQAVPPPKPGALLQPFLTLTAQNPQPNADETRRFAWWIEGNHLVLTVGTEPFESLLDVATGRRPNVISAAWHQALTKFNGYETDMRGYVDLEQALDLALRASESDSLLAPLLERPLRRIMANRLGLRGLKNLSFHLGFAGKYQRSTILVATDSPEKRQGLLKLLSAPLELDLDKLPQLPADADVVDFHRIDFARVYDELMDLARAIAAASAFQRGNWDLDELWDLDQLLGINTRKDLLASLDSSVILYGAHTEGPFILGATAAVKIKDQKKLERALENLSVVLAAKIGMPKIKFEERKYRGVTLHVMQGAPIAPTYAIHQGWLVMALYPQPVMGFVARAEGRRATWKTPPEVRDALAAAKAPSGPGSKLCTVWVTEPRRTMEIGLALLPAFANYLAFSLDLPRFDATKIPHARAVTEHLFPNVDILYDDGHQFRLESQFSIDVPLSGLWMAPYLFFGLGSLF